MNPDSLIARTNLARPTVDATYLGTLSDDAPFRPLIAELPSLDVAPRRLCWRVPYLARGGR